MADNRNDYTAQKVITSPVAQKVRKAIDSAQKAHLRPALRDGVRGSDNTALSRTFFDRPVPPQRRDVNRPRRGSGSLPHRGRGAAGAQRRAHGLHTALFRLSWGRMPPCPRRGTQGTQGGNSAGRHRDRLRAITPSYICGDSPWDGLSMAHCAWYFSSDIPACSWQ